MSLPTAHLCRILPSKLHTPPLPLLQAGFVRKQGSNPWDITAWAGTWLASGELDVEQKSWCSHAPGMRNLQRFLQPFICESWMDGHHWCLSTAWPCSVVPSPEGWGGHSWAAKRSCQAASDIQERLQSSGRVRRTKSSSQPPGTAVDLKPTFRGSYCSVVRADQIRL